MKKLLGVLVVVLLAVPAFAAPTSQGNFVVTLPLFQYVTYNDDLYEMMYGDEETNMIIGAENYQMGVEWFVIDGLAIGGGISYNTLDESEVTTTTIMPMLTYYYAMDKFIPYAGIGYKWEKWEDDASGADPDEITFTSIFLKAGAAYMLGNNLAAFGELSYSFDSAENGSEEDGTTMGIALGVKAFF